jgi:hypothetical protein
MGNYRYLYTLLLAIAVACHSFQGMPLSRAETPEVQTFVKTLDLVLKGIDPGAKIQQENLVTFSDGTQYVLVNPAMTSGSKPLQVTQRIPANATPSDVILLNDGHFLLRVVTLQEGRKTFAIPELLPQALREGLLPQNFTFPDRFLLPTIWKSLSGNLLTPPSSAEEQSKNYPLVLMSEDNRHFFLWDIGKNQVISQWPVTCAPASIVASKDAQTIYLGCASEPKLFVYRITAVSQEHTPQVYNLPAPVGSMVLEDSPERLYISYPTQPKLSVFLPSEAGTFKTVNLRRPMHQLAISNFRKQLYGVSIASFDPEEAPVVEKPEGALKKFFFNPQVPGRLTAEQQKQKNLQINGPRIQWVNLSTLSVEKQIPAQSDVQQLYVQDEKILWTVSRKNKQLQAFDLRWQEYSPVIPLSEVPLALGSDNDWLYTLMPQSNTIQRLNLKTLQWSDPIVLEPGSKPLGMVLDTRESIAYVLSDSPSGVAVVNLSRGEWVGTERLDFRTSGLMAWLSPIQESVAQQVRIKFQDGRLLIQNAQGRQWGASPTDLRALQKSQTPPEPVKTPSSPETNGPGSTPPKNLQSQ